LILAGVFFARCFRKLNAQTIVDYFEMRYGKGPAAFLSVLYVPVYLGWIGAQLLAFGRILESLTGLDATLSILISTFVVILYTYWGGMWADTLTDLFQMIILVAGLLVLFPMLVSRLGGWSAMVAATDPEKLRFFPAGREPLSWLCYIEAWMIVGIGSLPAQDLFQRIMAARNHVVARWSSIVAGVLYVGFGLFPVLLGIFGKLAMPESENDRILVNLALKYLPGPAIALMVGALLSAIMSSADSAILAPASIIGHNIAPLLKRGLSEEWQLRWCRWTVPILTFLSLGIAMYYQRIYDLCKEAWGVLLVGVAAPMIFGVYWRQATTAGAVAGAIAGTGSWVLFRMFLPEGQPCNLYGFAVSCLALVVVSLLPGSKRASAA
jgi:Na+/proline symporter